jgi:predicted alpha/beta superfamily hydrolase
MSLYSTSTALLRQLRVNYPAGHGRIVLRTDLEWDRDVEPVDVSADGETSTFNIEARKPFVYLKPMLQRPDGEKRWAKGPNVLLLMTAETPAESYPFFDAFEGGTFSNVLELDSAILGRKHYGRVYLPPGYFENTLRRYPVLYMHDGKNLFFPEEAFLGRVWKVDESLALLDAMNGVDQVVVVGVYSHDRMYDYTKPGYEAYARSIVEEIKPRVDAKIRTFTSPRETGVLGSSLGGVVSFFMAWEYPQVFGLGACMSSTFAHENDLIDRVLSEPKRDNKYYLDSGWPGDNYEVTLAMAMALGQRGFVPRLDFVHLMFPLDEHDENAWSRRLHIPLQMGLSKVATAHRGRHL